MPKNSKINVVAYQENSIQCGCGTLFKVDRKGEEKRILARHARFCTDATISVAYTTPKRHYLKLP